MQITEAQRHLFDEIFKLTGQCNSIFIAGGAVVNLDKCGDIDVWFGRNQHDKAEAFVNQLTFSTPYAMYTYQIPNGSLRGEGYFRGFIVQVMVTDAQTPQDQLSTFDITTHMWAYTSKGVLIKGQHATEWYEPPQVKELNVKTLSRYVKLCRHYGHTVDEATLTKIKSGECCKKETIALDAF